MSMEAAQELDEKAKFKIPDWATKAPAGAHLDVIKGDQLIQKLMIDEKKMYYFGRNPKQVDIAVDHASCSRVHAVLLYHSLLQRFALIDLDSSHGTFVGKIRIEPLKVVFLDIGAPFHFGASTRRYGVRLKPEQGQNFEEEEEKERLPNEQERDNLTEYNTAQNKRIPLLAISAEEARRKKRPRGNVTFIEEEDIINPEDVDPSIGRFRNLITTAIISNNKNGKRSSNELGPGFAPPRKVIRATRDVTISAPSCSSLGGISLNAAPDLQLYDKLPQPRSHNVGPTVLAEDDSEKSHKKYAKEAWPGRKPPTLF